MFFSEFWACTFCFLVQYPLLRADEFSGSSGSQSLPIHDRGNFVRETCKVITTAILRFVLVWLEQMQHLASFISLWNSLCSHTDMLTHSQDLELRVWGARSSFWSDNVPSFYHANKYSPWFFHCRHGSLGGSFHHWCDSTSYSMTVRIPHSCVFGCQPLILDLVCVLMSW